jgi:DNA-binding NarL/FixJ family response regulator
MNATKREGAGLGHDIASCEVTTLVSRQSVRAESRWLTEAVQATYASLSPKEQAVLLAAARGAEDKEIAAELGCTLSTVRTLWQRTYKKTHMASRRRLIAGIWEHACHLASLSFLERRDRPA